MTLVCRRRRRLDTCDNDDSTSDSFGDTCSGWYDDNDNCSGDYDDSDFSSNVQCCVCGGGKGCDILVSGSNYWSTYHGTYEQSGSCDGHPRWKCDNCGGGDDNDGNDDKNDDPGNDNTENSRSTLRKPCKTV